MCELGIATTIYCVHILLQIDRTNSSPFTSQGDLRRKLGGVVENCYAPRRNDRSVIRLGSSSALCVFVRCCMCCVRRMPNL